EPARGQTHVGREIRHAQTPARRAGEPRENGERQGAEPVTAGFRQTALELGGERRLRAGEELGGGHLLVRQGRRPRAKVPGVVAGTSIPGRGANFPVPWWPAFTTGG